MSYFERPASAEFGFSGPEWFPQTNSWTFATAGARRRYWRQLGLFAARLKKWELSQGIDKNGAPMPPRRHRRPDGASGPVLIPHWQDSRFWTLIGVQESADGVTLYWEPPWSRIVSNHALGLVRGAPIRNVVGLTWGSRLKLVRQAINWWQNTGSSGAFGVPGGSGGGAGGGAAPAPLDSYVDQANARRLALFFLMLMQRARLNREAREEVDRTLRGILRMQSWNILYAAFLMAGLGAPRNKVVAFALLMAAIDQEMDVDAA